MATMRKAALFFLLMAATASAQTVVVMRDGSRVEVEAYEVANGIVVLSMANGNLQSIPLESVDLEATEALSRNRMVSLRFGWKAGMSARVEVDAFRERSGTETRASRRSSSQLSYRLTVRDHPDGLLVDLDDFEFPVLELPEGAEKAGLVRMQLERIAAMSPSYVVTPAGAFLKVVAIEELANEVKALLEPMRSSIEGAGEQAKALLDRALSEEQLTATMMEQWNLLVGFWLDGDLDLGAVYELETMTPIPLLPGVQLPMRLEFGATQWLPCENGAPSPTCIELQFVSYPDPEKTKALVASFVEQFDRQPKGTRFEELHVENRAMLRAIPKTLLPYSLETVRSVRVSGTANGQVLDAAQTDRRTARIHWAP